MIWVGYTVASPLLAFVCWYAKGEGKISFIISTMIIAMLFSMSFVYGWLYFRIRSILELITFVCGVAVMKRDTMKGTLVMVATGICAAFVLYFVVPFPW